MPSFTELVAALRSQFPAAVVAEEPAARDPWVQIAVDAWPEVARALCDRPDWRFDTLSNLTAVDYFEPDEKKAAKFPVSPHIEVVYHLFSLVHRHRLVVKLSLSRWKADIPGDLPEVPSVASVWAIANWHERECYDLSGVRFLGHPDLTRILCPDDWVGHPLRKDYEMPREYEGIRAR
jgi:NADH-quinone oxidoreductase subunit C